jgi:hypothetical protein
MSVLYASADQATKGIGRLGVSAAVDVQVTLDCDAIDAGPQTLTDDLHWDAACPHRLGSAGANALRLLALSYFYDIAVWVAYVAAELKTVIFRFGEKLRSSASPLLVTGLNVGNADVYKAADFIGICRRP